MSENMQSGDDGSAGVVVVGVSHTSRSPAAVHWAADEAARLGARLLAVRAWRPSHPPAAASGRPAAVSRDTGAERGYAQSQLEADVHHVLGDGHRALCQIHEGSPLEVLQQASEQAVLVVLDAPRRAGLTTTPMLAHRLVYAAACPVVIMPPRLTGSSDAGASTSSPGAGTPAS